MKTQSELYSLSKHFALRVVKLYQYLLNNKKEYILSKQVLRSGTSIGANISEAVVAQSKADFIHKLHIALKECSETRYWLELLYASEYLTEEQFHSIYKDCSSLFGLLTASIKTAKKNITEKE